MGDVFTTLAAVLGAADVVPIDGFALLFTTLITLAVLEVEAALFIVVVLEAIAARFLETKV